MFGKRLNSLRKEKKITAQAMADKLGVALRTYQFYEAGKRSPSYETLVKIADILDVSLDYLLCRDDFMSSRGVRADGYPVNPQVHPKE